MKAGQFNNMTPTKKMQSNIFKNRLKVKTTLNEYIRVSQRTSGIFLHRIVVVWQQAVKHKVGAFCEVKKKQSFPMADGPNNSQQRHYDHNRRANNPYYYMKIKSNSWLKPHQ